MDEFVLFEFNEFLDMFTFMFTVLLTHVFVPNLEISYEPKISYEW